ncbi:MAG TPA: archease [Anaerolineales bacterium]|jgi:SHS2 domain-containing protein|nr:archease [Anaerolineales bacterium]
MTPDLFAGFGILIMMNEQPEAGYREVEHTADWQLEVWAPDLPLLFEQAALGMYALSGTRLALEPRLERKIELQDRDHEGLLVAFLSELLYLGESQGLGFDEFELQINGERLTARAKGARIESQSKEIKAVTYHNLEIREATRGLEVNIVFDV